MFFFWEAHHPLRRRVWLVYTLIALNALAFAYTAASGEFRPYILRFGFVPQNPLPDAFFTSMFLHADLWHLAGNMLYLWIYGDNLEDRLGGWLFAGAYLFTGTFATFGHWAASAGSGIPLVGASGAISGLMAFYVVMFPMARFRVFLLARRVPLPLMVVPAWAVVGFWMLLQVLGALSYKGGTAGVAYYGHLGGALSGLILALALTQGGLAPRDLEAGTEQDPEVRKRKRR